MDSTTFSNPSSCQNSIRNEMEKFMISWISSKCTENDKKAKSNTTIKKADISSSVICARAKEFYEMIRKIEDNLLKENLSCSISFYPNQEWYNEFRRKANREKLIISPFQ